MLEELARAGVGLFEIGKRMAASGFPLRERGARADRIRTLGISLAGLLDAGEPWSALDEAKLRTYVERGKNGEEAAALLWRPAAEVRAFAKRRGIALRPDGRRWRRPPPPPPPTCETERWERLTNEERAAERRQRCTDLRRQQEERIAAIVGHRMSQFRERVARGETLI